ncbi:Astacin-like metalloendopeptidase [Armadillidium vulgare]|nr:Astacin-like metalloendopeptidase [Armadillidium vulgare]
MNENRRGQTQKSVGDNIKATACGSFVGRRGGAQMVNFTKWCYMKLGHVLHELLHVLGFYHEQCRIDRDNFVAIISENIIQGYFKNFQKCQNTTDFGVGYDYYSVLHYDTFSLSKNGKPTIITLNPNYKDKIGQRLSLSEKDVLKLKLMYNCEEAFPNVTSE